MANTALCILVFFGCSIFVLGPRTWIISTARTIIRIERKWKLFNQSYKVQITPHGYLWPQVWTHTQMHTRAYPHDSNFKKSGACRPAMQKSDFKA